MKSQTFDVSNYPTVTFAPGEVLLEEGGRSNRVYILQNGTVSVFTGQTEVARLDTPDTILGEISAILGCENTATVKAESECQLCVIEDFSAYLRDHPDTVDRVREQMHRRLMNTSTAIHENLPIELQLASCEVAHYKADETIFVEGDEQDKIYILKAGKVRMLANGAKLRDVKTEGAVFGEMSAFLGEPASATLKAITDCSMFVIADVEEFFKTSPAASLRLSRYLATRLNDVINQFSQFRADIMGAETASARNPLPGRAFFDRLSRFDTLLRSDLTSVFGHKKSAKRS